LPQDRNSTSDKRRWLEGPKSVFSSRSASACVVGTALFTASSQLSILYNPSFFRERFLLSASLASILVLLTSSFHILDSLNCSKFAVRIGGVKRLTVLTGIPTGLLLMVYTQLEDLWLSAILAATASFLSGLRLTSSISLAIEQVPRSRGAMMSISRATDDAGTALGTGIGGLAIFLHGYETAGMILGATSVIASLIYHLLVTETSLNWHANTRITQQLSVCTTGIRLS
jgi:predicted MFS family arabinose efflux permease